MATESDWQRKFEEQLRSPDGMRLVLTVTKNKLSLALATGGEALRSLDTNPAQLRTCLSGLLLALGEQALGAGGGEVDLDAILEQHEKQLRDLEREAVAVAEERKRIAARAKQLRRILGPGAPPSETIGGKRASGLAARILEWAEDTTRSFGPAECADALGADSVAVNGALVKLAAAGKLKKLSRGVYASAKRKVA